MELRYLNTSEQTISRQLEESRFNFATAKMALNEIKLAKKAIEFVEELAKGNIKDPESDARKLLVESNTPEGAQKKLF